jgi:carbamate kinase
MSKLAVIAIGGNSLIKDEKRVTVEDQYKPQKRPPFTLPT